MPSPPRSTGVLGVPVRRKEDPRLITGRGRYVSDVELPRMLHVAFVRSPHAHAEVRGIVATVAMAHPGVVTVVGGDDPTVARHRIVRVAKESAGAPGAHGAAIRRSA